MALHNREILRVHLAVAVQVEIRIAAAGGFLQIAPHLEKVQVIDFAIAIGISRQNLEAESEILGQCQPA